MPSELSSANLLGRLVPPRARAAVGVRFFDGELHMFAGVRLPLRSMLVESPDKAILLSPVGTRAELVAIRDKPCILVEPNLSHHRRLADAIRNLHPRQLWAPPGFGDKWPPFGQANVFGADPWPHDDLLRFTLIEGAPAKNEIVFFHRASRTLFTGDLVVGAMREPVGVVTRIALRALGVTDTLTVMTAWSRWVKDPAAFRRSIDRVMAWPFERIAMAHGDICERDAAGDARGKLFAALRARRLV